MKPQTDLAQSLREGLLEIAAIERGERHAIREDIEDDRGVLIRIEEHGETTWTLDEALGTVRRMDVSAYATAADYLKAVRACLRQSQRGMALLLSIPKRTYEKWENAPARKERRSSAKLALLSAFATNPEVFLQAINNPPPFAFR